MIRTRGHASLAAILLGSAWLVACVPALPGGALDDGSGGAAAGSSGGAGNSAGGGPPGPGAGGASGRGIAAAPGPGSGGASGPGIGGSMASGGSAGNPFLFVSDAGYPPNVAVDANFAYWNDRNTQSIMRAYLHGGSPEVVAPASGDGWVAVDSDGGLYWSADGYLMKRGGDGGPPVMLGGSDTYVVHFVVGPDAVFFSTAYVPPPSSRIFRVSRDGGPMTMVASVPAGATALALDATNLYWASWADGGSVMKLGLSGGEPIELASSTGFGSFPSLVVDATSVYWVDGNTMNIMKVNINGGQPEPALAVAVQATSVAVQGAGVYWTDIWGAVYVAADAKAPRLLGSSEGGGASPYGVMLDATSVYWMTYGTIFRAPR